MVEIIIRSLAVLIPLISIASRIMIRFAQKWAKEQ